MPFQVLHLSKKERLKLLQKNNLLSIRAALNKFEINFIKFVLIIICKHLEIYIKTISRLMLGEYRLVITNHEATNCFNINFHLFTNNNQYKLYKIYFKFI